jgi:thiol-disulfide isomerase/thioredoxin
VREESVADVPTHDLGRRGRRHRLRRRRLTRLALTLVGAAALGSAAGWAYTSGGSTDIPSEGSQAKYGVGVTEFSPAERGDPVEVAGETLLGGSVSTRPMRGSIVVLNVWGSWCAPCRAEAPILATASRQYSDRGVKFLGINARDNAAAARAFEQRYEIRYPSIADTDGKAVLSLNGYVPASAVPVTVLLDREGRVAARVLGELRRATLTALLDRVLEEGTN